jgi:hypothetical protein
VALWGEVFDPLEVLQNFQPEYINDSDLGSIPNQRVEVSRQIMIPMS